MILQYVALTSLVWKAEHCVVVFAHMDCPTAYHHHVIGVTVQTRTMRFQTKTPSLARQSCTKGRILSSPNPSPLKSLSNRHLFQALSFSAIPSSCAPLLLSWMSIRQE